MAFTIVFLFLGSLMAGLTSEYNGLEPELLEEETIVQNPSQATSPGHVVFGQYISSDNCGHCSKTGGGSDAHHSLKQNHPDEYVYVTYMSASYGIPTQHEQETLRRTIGHGQLVVRLMPTSATELTSVRVGPTTSTPPTTQPVF